MGDERLDEDDGLPIMEVQEWAEEKHAYLRRYLDISHAARRKFLRGSGATYIELFSGPGRLILKHDQNGRTFDGSPLIAHAEAARTGTAFSMMHLGDAEASYCDAVEARLKKRGAQVTVYNMKSEAAAQRIVPQLHPEALHFAFLDPFNLGHLPFSIVETFALLKRIDMLVHFSAMDLARQLPGSMKAESATLDRFAPGWRKAVTGLPAGVEARGRIVEHWVELVRGIGFRESKVWNLIRGQNNQPLYWLVLVAKHRLATKFWDEVNKPRQGDMF